MLYAKAVSAQMLLHYPPCCLPELHIPLTKNVPVLDMATLTPMLLLWLKKGVLDCQERPLYMQIKVLCNGIVDTLGRMTFGGKVNHPFTAHPKVDPVTGKHIFRSFLANMPDAQTSGWTELAEMSGLVRCHNQCCSKQHLFPVSGLVIAPVCACASSLDVSPTLLHDSYTELSSNAPAVALSVDK